MSVYILVLIVLLLHGIAGTVIYWIGSRSPAVGSQTLIRRADRRWCLTHDPVNVELAFAACTLPVKPAEAPQPRDILLVVDLSGSMGIGPGSPRAEAIKAVGNFVDNCQESMRIGLVAFDDEASVVANLSSPSADLQDRLLKVQGGGGTRLDYGLDEAAGALGACPRGPGAGAPVVVLLSDGDTERELALAASERLKAAGVEVVTIGLGYGVDEGLMQDLASTEEAGRRWYFHIDRPEGLTELFGHLAASLHDVFATDVSIKEFYHLGAGLALETCGGRSPASIDLAHSELRWHSPHVSGQELVLKYQVRARRPGWYRLAEDGASAEYRQVDGQLGEARSSRAPWLLVLPRLSVWPIWWFLLNPFYWLCLYPVLRRLTRLVRREAVWQRPRETQTVKLAPAPPEPAVPAPLVLEEPKRFVPEYRPALVIGAGRSGLEVLTSLKAGLVSRMDGSPAEIQLRNFDFAAHESVQFAGQSLDEGERISIGMDLYPVLSRAHVEEGYPWLWDAGLRERGTGNDLTRGSRGDRRAAKLVLLEAREWVLEVLRSAVAETALGQVPELDVVVVAGSDGGCSGLVPDLCYAARKVLQDVGRDGVDISLLVVDSGSSGVRGANRSALARELNRINHQRGTPLWSDLAGHVDDAVARWVDRVFVLGPSEGSDSDSVSLSSVSALSAEAAEMLSFWLSSSKLRQFWRNLPEPAGEEGHFHRLGVQALRIPIREIDHYLIARASADLVVSRFLRAEPAGGRLRACVDPEVVGAVVDALLADVRFSLGRPALLHSLVRLQVAQECEREVATSELSRAQGMSIFELETLHSVVASQVPPLLIAWCAWVLNGDLEPADLEMPKRVVDARHGRLPLLRSALRHLSGMLDTANEQLGALKGRSGKMEPVVDQAISHATICRVHVKRLLNQVDVWHRVLIEGVSSPGRILGENRQVKSVSHRLLADEQGTGRVLADLVEVDETSARRPASAHMPRYLADRERIESIYQERYVEGRDQLLARFSWKIRFKEASGEWDLGLEINSDQRHEFEPTPDSLDRMLQVVGALVGSRVTDTWKESVAARATVDDVPVLRVQPGGSFLPAGVERHRFDYGSTAEVFRDEPGVEPIALEPEDPHVSASITAYSNFRFLRDWADLDVGARSPHVQAPEAHADRLEYRLTEAGAIVVPMVSSVVNSLIAPGRFAGFLGAALDGKIQLVAAAGTSRWHYSATSEQPLTAGGERLEQAVARWVLFGADLGGKELPAPDFDAIKAHVSDAAVSDWAHQLAIKLVAVFPGVSTIWCRSAGVAAAGLLLEAQPA